MNLITFSAVSP